MLSEDTNAFNVDERLFYNFNVRKVRELLGEKSGFVFSAKYKNEGKEYSISLKYSDDKKVTFWMVDDQNQRTSDVAIYKEFNKVLIEWFKKEYISRFSIDNLGNVKITYQ
ncbi:hypothetical protein [Pseudolactococcus reticulitermitis]|uniref:Uncharacterized protein n=1 Tax=Pseudolactococcus reticulitermitis TaxID=2025039 RepID=A0A224XFK1_9LACT|nr:hypothetical protein [Lactococcus reticulitermitis]GAX48331.1 hypothetical protein RsY01_1947 [Lactococcus reticulitermitis]